VLLNTRYNTQKDVDEVGSSFLVRSSKLGQTKSRPKRFLRPRTILTFVKAERYLGRESPKGRDRSKNAQGCPVEYSKGTYPYVPLPH
jgi:hypothetical protein